MGDAFTVLPFANTLVKLELTGSEFKQAMEEALAYAVSDGGSQGAYPYGAGIRYSVDLTEETGDRVSNLQVWDKGSQSWQPMSAQSHLYFGDEQFYCRRSGRLGHFLSCQ